MKKVAIIGATGMVGRRLAELLIDHPWFEVSMVVGSGASAGTRYKDVWEQKEQALQQHYGAEFWRPRPYPSRLRDLPVRTFEDVLSSNVDFIFSSIPERAWESESRLLDHGFTVFSNSPFGRFEEHNPLVVPEINCDQMSGKRFIKNPNCVTSGLALVLAPIEKAYGLREVAVTTYQSISGRGDAKYAKNLVVGNIYPLHGSSELTEVLIRKEVKRILEKPVPISISCNRVSVQEGHYVEVKVRTEQPIRSDEEARAILERFNPLRHLDLPSNPEAPLVVLNEYGRPRPGEDALHHGGFAVAVGNVSTDDEIFDLRLTYVVNNIVRGAAGGAILNAEAYHATTRERVVGA